MRMMTCQTCQSCQTVKVRQLFGRRFAVRIIADSQKKSRKETQSFPSYFIVFLHHPSLPIQ